MNIILLLAMLQGTTVNIKPAPLVYVVPTDVKVVSRYFERTKARISAAKAMIVSSDRKKVNFDNGVYYLYGTFYFNNTEIPLTRKENNELRLLIIEKEVEIARKKLEKL